MKTTKEKHESPWPGDTSGDKRTMYDLVKGRTMLRMIFNYRGECGVVDRHEKARLFSKYAGTCDRFRKCHLSIARYYVKPRILKEMGDEKVWAELEDAYKHMNDPFDSRMR